MYQPCRSILDIKIDNHHHFDLKSRIFHRHISVAVHQVLADSVVNDQRIFMENVDIRTSAASPAEFDFKIIRRVRNDRRNVDIISVDLEIGRNDEVSAPIRNSDRKSTV